MTGYTRCRNCVHNMGMSGRTDIFGEPMFVCMVGDTTSTLAYEYQDKPMVCPDYERRCDA